MKFSLMGRIAMATVASLALGLGMTACGGGTIAYLWVLGDQYNQITSYKVDDFTGNLTQSPGSPFSSQGSNPVSIVVKPGGRYVYVINQGTGGNQTTASTSSGISVYAVGGDGVLTFQQSYHSQGFVPQWAQFSSDGNYFYVLDKYSPDGTGVGAITAFAADSSTGRLTLVANPNVKVNNVPITYYNVGLAPTMMKTLGSCLMTIDTGDRSVFAYQFGSAGALNVVTTQTIATSASSLSSINGNGSLVLLTDATANKILPYTLSSSCGLNPVTGGSVTNLTGTANPVYSLIDNSGKYVYVLNQSTTSTTTTTPFSSISAFTIVSSTSQLTPIAGSPYPVGSNPVCMVEDPTNQYIYVSNRNDGTVTGKIINSTTGELSDLKRGSTFQASGLGACLALSGSI